MIVSRFKEIFWLFACIGLVGCTKQSPEATFAVEAASNPIKIGVLLPFTGYKEGAFLEQKGIDLAVEQINATGGVRGRPLEVLYRDTNLNPADAIRAAEGLVNVERVTVLMGTIGDHVGSAVGNFAEKNKILFLRPHGFSSNDHPPWRYFFALGASSQDFGELQAELVAPLKLKTWAILAPNYEFGQVTAAGFKNRLLALNPETEFVYEQFYPMFKLDAGPTVQAMDAKDPQGIFVATFGTDNIKFLREGRVRGLFENTQVVTSIGGQPEELSVMGEEAPEGWLAFGYPAEDIPGEQHQAFVRDFQNKYDQLPMYGSLLGFISTQVLAESMLKAKSFDSDDLIASLTSSAMDTVVGPIEFSKTQSRGDFGLWAGRTGFKDGSPTLLDWSYISLSKDMRTKIPATTAEASSAFGVTE